MLCKIESSRIEIRSISILSSHSLFSVQKGAHAKKNLRVYVSLRRKKRKLNREPPRHVVSTSSAIWWSVGHQRQPTDPSFPGFSLLFVKTTTRVRPISGFEPSRLESGRLPELLDNYFCRWRRQRTRETRGGEGKHRYREAREPPRRIVSLGY